MADLVAITYPDEETAEESRMRALEHQTEILFSLDRTKQSELRKALDEHLKTSLTS